MVVVLVIVEVAVEVEVVRLPGEEYFNNRAWRCVQVGRAARTLSL